MIEVTTSALAGHPFLRGMSREHLDALAAVALDVMFPASRRLFEDGGAASRFWLIRSGHVALDVHVPGEGPMVVETVGMGELLGWSWLFPPYRWVFGAVTLNPLEAFQFDAVAVRDRCAADPELSYQLSQRVAHVLAKRLQATRMRLIARSGRVASLY